MAILKTKLFVDNEMAKLKELSNPDGVFHIYQFGDNKASTTYVRNKIKDAESIGIRTELHKLPEWTPRGAAETHIKCTRELKSTIGIMVQFPIPKHLEGIEQLVPPHLDVDGLVNNSHFYPCTPSGIISYLKNGLHIDLTGKNVCIVGRGELVGAPLVQMMIDENATVTLCHSKTRDLRNHTFGADIVICAIGKPKFFDGTYFSDDTLVIDVGTNFDENGKLCGDVDTEKVEASNQKRHGEVDVTAVPGGVGLLTRMALMRHCYGLDKKENKV